MTLVTLLVLPLVGGYGFSLIWNPSSFKSNRETGQRLYFRAIFYGVFLTICSGLLHIWLFTATEFYQPLLQSVLNEIEGSSSEVSLTDNISIVSVLAMTIMGPFVGHLLNFPAFPGLNKRFIFAFYQRKLLEYAIENDDFERLLHRGIKKNIPVLISLQNGKVYIGFSVRVPNPAEERKALRILPLLSGYRDKETHELIITTNYHNLLVTVHDADNGELDHLEFGDIEVVIPLDNICSSHLFDIVAYITQFSNDEDSKQEMEGQVSDKQRKLIS